MVAKDKNGKSVKVPGLLLTSQDAVRRFARSVLRQEEARKREESFRDPKFDLAEYLHLLENQNVKVELGN